LIGQIPIAVASDQRYLPGAIGTLASLRMALEPEVAMEVSFLHDGLAEDQIDRTRRAVSRIRGKTEIRFYHIEAKFAGFPDFYFPTKMPYARLLLSNFVDAGKILYVDSDILSLKSPVSLFGEKAPQTGLGAVLEATMPHILNDAPSTDPGVRVDLDRPYFNSGFLMIDLDAVRKSGLIDRALSILTANPRSCRLHDQSALNYAANGDFDLLGQDWNTQTHRVCFDPVAAIESLAARSINVHFVTKAKPWLSWCPFPADEMFRVLLDKVDPGWRTAEYSSREAGTRRKYHHAGALTAIFRLRAHAKKILLKNPQSDLATAKFWRGAAADDRALRSRSRNFNALLDGWRVEIDSKAA
jgi:lipopolysaccharide biosynthesis glycosyltransferase